MRGGEERDYYRAGVNAFSFAAAAAPSKRTLRATGAGGEFAARRPRGFSAARSARSRRQPVATTASVFWRHVRI